MKPPQTRASCLDIALDNQDAGAASGESRNFRVAEGTYTRFLFGGGEFHYSKINQDAKKQAGMFIGPKAKTWNADAARQAEEMLAKNIDPREVWKQTGTLKGVDGALRQEIPDNAAKFPKDWMWDYDVKSVRSAVDHPDLYGSYPELLDTKIRLTPSSQGGGLYDSSANRIDVFSGNKPDAIPSINLHELQHAIQQREGWARGGSPDTAAAYAKGFNTLDEYSAARQQAEQAYWDARKNADAVMTAKRYKGQTHDIRKAQTAEQQAKTAWEWLRKADEGEAFNAYQRLAGEAEARLTQSRMNLDAAQRLEHYPYDAGPYGFDVPADQQIVRGLLDGPAMSYADEAKKVKKK